MGHFYRFFGVVMICVSTYLASISDEPNIEYIHGFIVGGMFFICGEIRDLRR